MRTDYKEPQPLNKKAFYKIELMLLRLDCKGHKYSILRDIKLDAAHGVVADTDKASAPMSFNPYFSGDTGKLPIAEQNTVLAGDACYPLPVL